MKTRQTVMNADGYRLLMIQDAIHYGQIEHWSPNHRECVLSLEFGQLGRTDDGYGLTLRGRDELEPLAAPITGTNQPTGGAGRLHAAIVKGLIEQGDPSAFFGATGALGSLILEAIGLGLVDEEKSMASARGRAYYIARKLHALPDARLASWADQDWDLLVEREYLDWFSRGITVPEVEILTLFDAKAMIGEFVEKAEIAEVAGWRKALRRLKAHRLIREAVDSRNSRWWLTLNGQRVSRWCDKPSTIPENLYVGV